MNPRAISVSPADVAEILRIERRELARARDDFRRRQREHIAACVREMPVEVRDEDEPLGRDDE